MTDRLMDHLWVPRALSKPSAAINLSLSQNAATHWTSSAWMYSVDYILIAVFSCENNLIARVSFLWVLSDGSWSHQQFVTKLRARRPLLGALWGCFHFFARLSWGLPALLAGAWLCVWCFHGRWAHFLWQVECVCPFIQMGSQSTRQVLGSLCKRECSVRGWGHFQAHFNQLALPPHLEQGTEPGMPFCGLWTIRLIWSEISISFKLGMFAMLRCWVNHDYEAWRSPPFLVISCECFSVFLSFKLQPHIAMFSAVLLRDSSSLTLVPKKHIS